MTTCTEAVIASERSERGDLFVRLNWIAFAPHAFARIFCDTCHRYAVLEMEVRPVATHMSPLRGFDLANGEANTDDADVLGDKIINLSQRRRERREILPAAKKVTQASLLVVVMIERSDGMVRKAKSE